MAKRFWVVLIFGLIVAVGAAATYGFFVFRSAQQESAAVAAQVPNDSPSKFIEATPQVLGDATQKTDAAYSSQHYHIAQISFGADTAINMGSNTQGLQVNNMHGELLTTQDQSEIRYVITWQTNKLGQSQIEYAKNGAASKILKESGYGFVHSVVLSDLEPSSAYTYQITTSDQWGNQVKSDRYAMYTSQKALSVFDLITAQFSQIFGWAIKK
jgi:flagellar basal body-associated protein FliL